MRRMLVASVIVALGLGAATAQATIFGTGELLTEVLFKETITVAGTVVDVYKITQKTDDGVEKLGAVLMGIGNEPALVTPGHGPNPYQGWAWYGFDLKTPNQTEAIMYLAADPSAREADSHFLPNPADWSPVVLVPDERNNASIGIIGTIKHGVGGLHVQSAVPALLRLPTLDVAHVGVIRVLGLGKDVVWGLSMSRDEGGHGDNYEFPIPEPATLTLLGLGAVALIRRRR